MADRFRLLLNLVRERLWVRPLAVCIVSIAFVFLAKVADDTGLGEYVPDIASNTIVTLLKVISTSMLVIATFAVASMVSAYASASTTATPRSFSLVIADDVSQNALSTFIGAFIFSIVGLVAVLNGYYDKAGRFALFALTIMAFVIVIAIFVRWVDNIARLGRLQATIGKAEKATMAALRHQRRSPHLGGVPKRAGVDSGRPVYSESIGYVQHVQIAALQKCAKTWQARVTLTVLPGAFVGPGCPVAYARAESDDLSASQLKQIAQKFIIGGSRKFDEDPRFGLIVLSEISSRALSPAVNDPGTAIDILGTFERLFAFWASPTQDDDAHAPDYDRVEVPAISLELMFSDAFSAVARDGAGMIEVAVRVQRALELLATSGGVAMRNIAIQQARIALARAETALSLPQDLETVRAAAQFSR